MSTSTHEHDETARLGRITAQQQTIEGSRVHQYAYDAAGRLISHTVDGVTTTWGFDANGNRTHENGNLIATYDSEDRLQSWKGNTYSYNAAGDLQGKATPTGSTGYTYDTLGNLTGVILPSGDEIQYLIDPLNRRIGKRKNGALQYGLLYRDGLRPVAQLDANGRIHAVFIYAEKANVPSAMLTADGKLLRIISDHLGSVRMVIDTGNNTVAQQMDYDAWGKVIADTNPGLQPFGFAGGLYDHETGLTRFGARDYDAETGRWTAKDPILFAGGDTNLYGYVLQNPVNFIDPEGLATQCEIDTALDLLQEKYPGWYPKRPRKIKSDFYLLNVKGSYLKSSDVMSYNFYYYGSDGMSVSNSVDNKTYGGDGHTKYGNFLQTIAHEMLHVNQTTRAYYLSREYGVDDFAWELTLPITQEYYKRIGETCQCQ